MSQKIIQIIPCTFPMKAVYYDAKSGELSRWPVRVLALISDDDDGRCDEFQYIQPYGVCDIGLDEISETCENFLGYEDEVHDWNDEVAKLKAKLKK